MARLTGHLRVVGDVGEFVAALDEYRVLSRRARPSVRANADAILPSTIAALATTRVAFARAGALVVPVGPSNSFRAALTVLYNGEEKTR